MMRFLIALALIVGCYNIPLADPVTTLYELQIKTCFSFLLMVLVIVISTELWAIGVALVELSLLVVDFFIAISWPKMGWLAVHYADINSMAFALELIIVIESSGNARRNFIDWLADFGRRSIGIGGR
jgi:hypothetical protein